jgi:hypothetical protein
MATAVWIAAAALTSGGVTALIAKRTIGARAADHGSSTPSNKEDHHG